MTQFGLQTELFFSSEIKLRHYIIIFSPSWPSKWKKIESRKNYWTWEYKEKIVYNKYCKIKKNWFIATSRYRVSHSRRSMGRGGTTTPILQFLWKPPIKTNAPNLKMKSPPSEKQTPKKRNPFYEIIPRKKKLKKLETVINTCVSIIKQQWKKMAEIPQECDFINWSIQNFVRKVKQFVKKYYIASLITQFVAIIKQHWNKMAEIPQECDFITWSNQNFVQKKKQLVKKYYTWLIMQLVVIDIAPLMVLFCNCMLVDLQLPNVKRY